MIDRRRNSPSGRFDTGAETSCAREQVNGDGAVSGEVSSNSATPGVSNGIVSFKAGFDNTPIIEVGIK